MYGLFEWLGELPRHFPNGATGRQTVMRAGLYLFEPELIAIPKAILEIA
jgi:hypothetical protein